MNTPHSILYKCFLLSQSDGTAQRLLKSQQGSTYTYLYKITNVQAENKYVNLDDSFFEVLIDSFLVTEHYKKALPTGHYLKAYSNKNRVEAYGKKPTCHRHPEVHREYFKNEVAIFCEKLPIGEYTFSIELMPRYTGTYTLNPAKIELMCFPTFSANDEIKKVLVD